MIRIRTLGGLGIDADGRDVSSLTTQRLRCALLVYLAIEREVSRDIVREMFWPGHEPGRANRVLDRHLRELTRVLGSGWLKSSAQRMRITPIVEADVTAFETAVRNGAYDTAVALYHGPFMAGFHVPGGRPFEFWLAVRRQRIDAGIEQARAALGSRLVAAAPVLPKPAIPPTAAAPLVRVVTELKRRQVFRVAWGFCLAAFAIVNIANLAFSVHFPEVYGIILLFVLFAFPVALLLAWVFELTPEGELRWEVSGVAVTGRWARTWRGRLAVAVIGVGTVSIAGVALIPRFGSLVPRLFGATLDSSVYVVFPFSAADSGAGGPGAEEHLRAALQRWSGISVVNAAQVRDALRRDADRTPDPARARSVAAKLRAGRFVTGSSSRMGDRVRVHAALYESTGQPTPVTEAFVDIRAGDDAGVDAAFFELSNRLVFGNSDSPEVEWPGTMSVRARQHYERARILLEQWDVAAADSLLGLAISSDPEYSRAHLERAQLRMWSGYESRSWASSAQRAAGKRLSPREQQLASALALMVRAEYPRACMAYEALIASDGKDIAAWFGSAECRRRDYMVTPDRLSVSGWSFRSSYHQVLEAYRRAFQLEPRALRMFAAESYDVLRRYLFTKHDHIRHGEPPKGDPAIINFDAIPERSGDTVAFVPYPRTRGAAESSMPFTPAHSRALQRQRELFREFARMWVREDTNAESYQSLAIAMDLLGDGGALDTLMRARAVTINERQAASLARSDVIMRIKLNAPGGIAHLERARILADSLLVKYPDGGDEPELMAAIAALVGRPHQAAVILARVDHSPIPVALASPYARLLAYSALGAPADSIREIGNIILTTINSTIPADTQPAVRAEVLTQSAWLAYPAAPEVVTSWLPADNDYVLGARAALHAGDTTGVRRILADIAALRANIMAVDRGYDGLFIDTDLLYRAGYLQLAARNIDPSLAALRFANPQSLSTVYAAGALVRSMALRAEIANRLGDAATARKWAHSVLALWSGADASLLPVVRRMESIGSTEGVRRR